MSPRISQYPEKCQLCGTKRVLVEGQELFRHSVDCNWRNDPSWQDKPKPPQTGHLDLAVRWGNGNSWVTATITQEQYTRILAIIQEKEPI